MDQNDVETQANDLYKYIFNEDNNLGANIRNLKESFTDEGAFYDHSKISEISDKIANKYNGKTDREKIIDYENFIDVYEEIKKMIDPGEGEGLQKYITDKSKDNSPLFKAWLYICLLNVTIQMYYYEAIQKKRMKEEEEMKKIEEEEAAAAFNAAQEEEPDNISIMSHDILDVEQKEQAEQAESERSLESVSNWFNNIRSLIPSSGSSVSTSASASSSAPASASASASAPAPSATPPRSQSLGSFVNRSVYGEDNERVDKGVELLSAPVANNEIPNTIAATDRLIGTSPSLSGNDDYENLTENNENRDLYPICPIDKFQYYFIKSEASYNNILIYFFFCELDKKTRLPIPEEVDESFLKRFEENITDDSEKEKLGNIHFLFKELYYIYAGLVEKENNKDPTDFSLYKISKNIYIKLDLILKYRYFFELYQYNEFTRSLSKLIVNMNNYGEPSYVDTPKLLIDNDNNKSTVPKSILPNYLKKPNTIEIKLQIKPEYYSNYKEINYGSKYYAKQKTNGNEKEDITTKDKDDENYEILGLKRISTNSNTLVKDDNMSWISAVLYAFISHTVLFQIYKESLNRYDQNKKLFKFYNELLHIRNYDIASVSTVDDNKKVIFDKQIYIYAFFLANMYDLETLDNNGEISSELKNLIEIDSDIFKDYNAFDREYFILREKLNKKNPEEEEEEEEGEEEGEEEVEYEEHLVDKIIKKVEEYQKNNTFFEQTNMNNLDPERMNFNPLNPKKYSCNVPKENYNDYIKTLLYLSTELDADADAGNTEDDNNSLKRLFLTGFMKTYRDILDLKENHKSYADYMIYNLQSMFTSLPKSLLNLHNKYNQLNINQGINLPIKVEQNSIDSEGQVEEFLSDKNSYKMISIIIGEIEEIEENKKDVIKKGKRKITENIKVKKYICNYTSYVKKEKEKNKWYKFDPKKGGVQKKLIQ